MKVKPLAALWLHLSPVGADARLWVAQHFLPAQPWPPLFTASFPTLAKVHALCEPGLLMRAAEHLILFSWAPERCTFAASLGTTKDLFVVDLAFRVQHKDAGMQISEAQHLFVLLLIKYATLEDVMHIFSSHHLLAEMGKFGGTWDFWWCHLLLPSNWMRLNNLHTALVLFAALVNNALEGCILSPKIYHLEVLGALEMY